MLCYTYTCTTTPTPAQHQYVHINFTRIIIIIRPDIQLLLQLNIILFQWISRCRSCQLKLLNWNPRIKWIRFGITIFFIYSLRQSSVIWQATLCTLCWHMIAQHAQLCAHFNVYQDCFNFIFGWKWSVKVNIQNTHYVYDYFYSHKHFLSIMIIMYSAS